MVGDSCDVGSQHSVVSITAVRLMPAWRARATSPISPVSVPGTRQEYLQCFLRDMFSFLYLSLSHRSLCDFCLDLLVYVRFLLHMGL